MRNGRIQFVAGLLLGTALVCCTGAASTATEAVLAHLTTSPIYLDGEQVSIRGYNIAGHNYFMLRDVGQLIGFNVYWDSENQAIQIDSSAPYTGSEPEPQEDMDQVREEIISLVNQCRLENGRSVLAVNQALMDAAQECSSMHFTWHNNQVECETVSKHGYPYGFGSNLTVFTGTAVSNIAQQAVKNWTDSPGHFQTMIAANADSIGVGVSVDRGITYCYLFIGKPNTYNPYS